MSVGLLRPIDWAALAKACPSSSSSSRGSAVNDGGEADKAFRARVRVEMDAAWTAMDGETTRLQRRLRQVGRLDGAECVCVSSTRDLNLLCTWDIQIEAAAARHGLGGRAGGAKGIGKEEEEEEEGMGDGGDGDDGALMEEGAAAMHGMRRPPPLPPSPVAEAAAAKRGTSDDAHDEAYWKERVAVALAEVHSRAAALAAGKVRWVAFVAAAPAAACLPHVRPPSI